MSRKTFDKLASTLGLMLAVLLAVAGGLLTWGANFTSNEVKTQLAAQKITMPGATGNPKDDAATVKFFKDNAGKPMTTVKQAHMYADHFIAFHLSNIGGGKTYSELSAQEMGVAAQLAADPKNATLIAEDQALQGKVATVFKGESLRGMLLNAYAFGTLGVIAQLSAYAAFIGALLFLLLALMGFAHLRRVEDGDAI